MNNNTKQCTVCTNIIEHDKLNGNEQLASDEKAVAKSVKDYERNKSGFISSLNQRAKCCCEAWMHTRPSLVEKLGGFNKMVQDVKRVAFYLAKDTGLTGKYSMGKDIPAVYIDAMKLFANQAIIKGMTKI